MSDPVSIGEVVEDVKRAWGKWPGEEWAKAINERDKERERDAKVTPLLNQIPRRYQEATVEVDSVRDWLTMVLANPRKADSLALVGPTGTGKTWTMWGIYRQLVERELNVVAINLIEFLDQLRPGASKEEVNLTRLERATVLLIDDLGMHKGSEWADERLYLILNTRYEQMRPGVFTTNYPTSEWAKVLGDRVASRLLEDCTVMQMLGRDRRRG